MEIMGVIGVIVNCALIGLSGPVHRMFPDMTPAQTVILIIVLEHVMLLLKFLISAAIPDIPHHVEMELARTEYKRREVERLITHQRVAELQVCLLLVDIAQWESALGVSDQQFVQIGNYFTNQKELLSISP